MIGFENCPHPNISNFSNNPGPLIKAHFHFQWSLHEAQNWKLKPNKYKGQGQLCFQQLKKGGNDLQLKSNVNTKVILFQRRENQNRHRNQAKIPRSVCFQHLLEHQQMDFPPQILSCKHFEEKLFLDKKIKCNRNHCFYEPQITQAVHINNTTTETYISLRANLIAH